MPAGGALAVGVSYRFYGSWGFTRGAITRNVVVTGIWNIFSKLALPVVAMVLLVSTGGGGSGVVAAAVVGLVVLALAVALGLAGTLIAMGGANAQVVAGVLVFRALSFFVSVPLGLGTFVVWKKMQRWRRPVPHIATV
jgi:hypothetical protein